MTPELAELYALRALVDAMILRREAEFAAVVASAAPADPVQTCPTCGASGETQQAVKMLGGRTQVFCQQCKQARVVGGPSTE